MSRLTEDKKNLIRKRLAQGQSIKDVAQEAQVSERTVIRYKKNLPPVLEEARMTGDNTIKVNYTTYLTKMEEAYAEKIKKELMLYDDKEEGWVFHVTKGDLRLRQSGYWWSAIVYPDSAPPDWIEKLRLTGLRVAISPLHDKDWWSHDSPEIVDPITGEIYPKGYFYKAGDRKKAHWHIIVVVDKRTGYVEMNDLIRSITHGPYIQKCRSLKNSFDYFLHINHPEKYQGYDKAEIQRFNNFHVEPTKYESGLIAQEMVLMIKEHNLIEWADCVNFFQPDPEYFLLLSTRTAFFSSYVKSLYYKQNPNQIKRTEVKVVDQFDFEKEDKEYF